MRQAALLAVLLLGAACSRSTGATGDEAAPNALARSANPAVDPGTYTEEVDEDVLTFPEFRQRVQELEPPTPAPADVNAASPAPPR